jgi:hypothetical protein
VTAELRQKLFDLAESEINGYVFRATQIADQEPEDAECLRYRESYAVYLYWHRAAEALNVWNELDDAHLEELARAP